MKKVKQKTQVQYDKSDVLGIRYGGALSREHERSVLPNMLEVAKTYEQCRQVHKLTMPGTKFERAVLEKMKKLSNYDLPDP